MFGLISRMTESQQSRRLGYDYIHPGILGQIIGLVTLAGGLMQKGMPAIIVGSIVIGMATVVAVIGCARFARHFGYSDAWGLLGFLSVIGYLTLHFVVWAGQPRDAGREGFDVVHAAPYVRDVWRMDVKVTLDPQTGIDVGNEPIQLQLPRGADVKAAMVSLSGVIPSLRKDIPNFKYHVNDERADLKTEMSHGDRLTVGG